MSITEVEGTWEELAAHAEEFAGLRLRLTVLPEQDTASPTLLPKRRLSARELLQLPLEERNRILEAQAAKAEAFYRNDPELTAFEAFDTEDLYDEYPEDALNK